MAYIHLQEESPGIDPRKALEFLKQQPRIEFNELNEVFTYVVRGPCFAGMAADKQPELTFSNVPALRTYIRTNSTPLQGVPIKTLREALPAGGPISIAALEELETKGDLLIMRGLGGAEFKDVPLPALGQKNAFGVGITEGRNDRWKTAWWDDLKERGRTGKRLTQGE